MRIEYIFSILVYLLVSILLFIILYVLILSRYNKKITDRFDKYTIKSNKNTKPSFFDTFFRFLNNIITKLSNILNKSAVLNNYGKKFDKYVENNKYKGIDLVSIKILLSLCFGLLYIISSSIRFNFNIMFLLLIIILSFFLIDIYYIFDYKNNRKIIEKDLLNAIIIMNNAFKSGMNITEAVNIVSNELTGPIKKEFIKIKMDIDYGLSLEVVFDRFYERVKIEDIKYISSSLSLINKTGGNIVKVFDSIEKNFYDKKKINDELNSLTSSSKFMFKLLVTMPILLIIVIILLNKEFFLPLVTTIIGRFIILIMLILYVSYIILIKSILRVKYYE